jgi:hypothetical protein
MVKSGQQTLQAKQEKINRPEAAIFLKNSTPGNEARGMVLPRQIGDRLRVELQMSGFLEGHINDCPSRDA